LGSGTGVAAIVYLGEQGLDYSQGFGMYMLQYAFHKMGIAVFSGLFFALNWHFMSGQFGDYFGLLVGGYALTALITAGLILFCCSARFHRLLFWLLDAINAKTRWRFHTLSVTLHEQCQMLEDASKKILRSGKLVAEIAALNLVRDAFWYGIPYLTFASTGAISLPETMAVTSLSVMLAAVIPTPAGIGSTEFVFSNLFASCVGSDLAVSASLLYRFATFVFPFLVGGVIVLVRRIRANKR
jgi:uncharacterized protein (TIRG00374 family)